MSESVRRSHPGVLALAGLAAVGLVVVSLGLLASQKRPGGRITAAAAVYDPANSVWTPTGNMVVGRSGHTAVLLTDGRVGVSGGTTHRRDDVVTRPEVWNAASGSWQASAFETPPATLTDAWGPRDLEPGCSFSTVKMARFSDGREVVVTSDHSHVKPAGGAWGPRIEIERLIGNPAIAVCGDGALVRSGRKCGTRSASLLAVLLPGTDRWVELPEWPDPGHYYDPPHRVVALVDGRALVVRGTFGETFHTVLLDPKALRHEPAGSFAGREYPQYLCYAALPDGGAAALGERTFLRWSARDRTWSEQPPPSSEATTGRSLTRLGDGRLLCAGGYREVIPTGALVAAWGVPLSAVLLCMAVLRTLVSWRARSGGASALATLGRLIFVTGALVAVSWVTASFSAIRLPGVTTIPLWLILGDGAVQLHGPAALLAGLSGLVLLLTSRGDAQWDRGVAVLTWALAFTLAIVASTGAASLVSGVVGYPIATVVILLAPLSIAPVVARALAPDAPQRGVWKVALAACAVAAFAMHFVVNFTAILYGWLML